MKVLFAVVCLTIVIYRSDAVSCQCSLAKCPPVDNEKCPRGIAQDICSCCSICAGVIGEHCGGPWGIYGSCGEGLKCEVVPCPYKGSEVECYLFYLQEPGKCVEERRHKIADLLQGAHLGDVHDSTQSRRLKLIQELESLKKK